MTETRIYFEKLVTLFDSLCKIQENELVKFVKLKIELSSLLTEIDNYKLLEIDLPQKCIDIANSEDCGDLSEEQSLLVVHLADQLCDLLIGKIWYGGELMYHLNRLTMSSYNLPDHLKEEVNLIYDFSGKGMNLRIRLRTDGDSKKIIEEISKKNKNLIDSTLNKHYQLDKEKYEGVKRQLLEGVSEYRSYINTHYPSIANQFVHNNKLVKAYFCDERNDKIVLRVQTYQYESDISVYLDDFVYDFCPRPPFNFEKINAPLVSWSWFGIHKSDWKIPENILSIEHIHRELLGIYLKHADDSELVQFVCFFIRTQNFEVEINKKDNTYLTIDGISTNEYLKVFHSNEITKELLDQTMQNLNRATIGYHKQVLFTTKPDDIVINMFEDEGIKVRHISELTYRHFDNKHSEIIHLFIKSRLPNLKIIKASSTDQGQLLIKELKNCSLGKSGWPNYEKISAEIFKFLFSDSFTRYISETQASNDEDSLRRDLIIHNNFKDSGSFWGRINSDFHAKLLIVEFKNYSEEIEYDTMFSTTKYLKKKTGNFVLIMSRFGGKSKLLEQQKELLSDGKLIILIDDIEIIEMIEEKLSGRNPLYRLELKYFSLLKR
ncbi:MAG: hypothetical protein IPP37_19615 [Saprospiraceae bacterium]|nr:hypothetical protein [Saprospiraceae bacterium]